MSPRYSLRFESGERTGETVPLEGSPFLVGRKPGNSLQIAAISVSGKHAELTLEGGELRVRDLGSTNGTRVGKRKIDSSALHVGDRVSFGDVTLQVLADGAASADMGAGGDTDPVGIELELELELEEPTPEPVLQAPISARQVVPPSRRPGPSADFALEGADLEGSEAHVVSAEVLERAAKGSSKLPLLMLVLVAVAAAGAYWFYGRGGAGGTPNIIPVVEVPGNLLRAGASFEGSPGWTAREEVSDSFRALSRARVSGSRGVRTDGLSMGASAFHDSDLMRVMGGKRFDARAQMRRGSSASAALGVIFSSAGDDQRAPGTTTVWSQPVESGASFAEAHVGGTIPDGYDRARVVIAAHGPPGTPQTDADVASDFNPEAWVEADDVSFVQGVSTAPSQTLDEVRFYGLGQPTTALAVFKIDALLVSGLRLRAQAGGGASLPMTLTEEAQGVRLAWSASSPVVLSARLEARLLDSGVATLGSAGYGPRGGAFEAEGVTDLLAGAGNNLLRLAFGREAQVVGSPSGGGLRVEVQLPATGAVLLQTRFKLERTEAINLAANARQATARGDLGEALKNWKELLERYPYEAAAVAEADAARSSLVQSGLDGLTALGDKLERARFFALADLYRECRDAARSIEETYTGSEVALSASALVAALDEELSQLDATGDHNEALRLEAIQRALEELSAKSLAAAVSTYTTERFPAHEEQGEEH